ncbi:hypothetical protein LL50_05315 [Listeria monocytogenes]|nr:hypothetical protein [Listeria monocytogenes]EAD0383125.1 hypothetical protein [Listeria monocytogenes]EAD9126947.1 hypothetical protein [Listeria monocytogenes]EAE9168071.1 hypothetical protein [Listeria monocytogenes]EAF2023467.1 hypothetical protein [Listeria monocytogenes]
MNISTEIVMTDHAIKRAKERLNIPEGTAQRWAVNRLKGNESIKKIAKNVCEYESGGVTFIVRHQKSKSIVQTCYKTIDDPLKKKIGAFLTRELSKAKRTYNAINKEILYKSAHLYSEISEETAKLARTTNPKAILKINKNLQTLNAELEKIQKKHNEAEKDFKIMSKQIDKLTEF